MTVQDLKLSNVEVESLRQMRTRLNRSATSDAASATLGRAFFQIVARVGVAPDAVLEKSADSAAQLLAAVGSADLAGLRDAMNVLQVRLGNPPGWRALQTAGVPQAVISRRLQLAGREPSADGATS
jgi:hypothetical protein